MFEVDFEEDEKGNPMTWPLWYKGFIITIMSYATTTVVLYSTSYTSAIPGLMDDLGISRDTSILGMTTYLLGMACGSVVLAPLSEMYGRRPVYITALGLFVVFVLPCALATNIATILVFRFIGAFCASALISNAPGTVNDISDEEHRALAFSIWSIGPMNGRSRMAVLRLSDILLTIIAGPVIGSVVGGFVFQYMGWRWTNWIVVIVSGVAFMAIILIPETYVPAILRTRAAKRREETDDKRYWSRYDEKTAFLPLLKVNLSRPFIMTFTEPILIFWDLYVALVYGILYLCFVAYPIVFNELRGWSPGIGGLGFVGIGVGSLIVIAAEPLIRRVINAHKHDPETGRPPPEASVSVICIGAMLLPIGQIWFSWTSIPHYHWILPILAGVPFGAGNIIIFIYGSNYLVHSYGIYAASALAGNAVLRSILGATLPLAGASMYAALGPQWAGTLLGLLEAVCIPIPVIFYLFGSRIRQKSALIRIMQEDKKRFVTKRANAERTTPATAEAATSIATGSKARGAVAIKAQDEKVLADDPEKGPSETE
jgi:MFS family permease